uniref:Right handed beta helix domain-containing protein n=1 Tax=Desulfovibrio sp. U5L TaxID=596152 RepID=I2Q334_9BACT
MSLLRRILLAVLGPLLLLEAALAADIQIRPTDAPAGLEARLRSVPPGTVLRIAPGLYPQGIQLSELRGTPAAPIRITADPGGAGMEGWRDKKAKAFGEGSGILLQKASNVVIEGVTIAGFVRGVTLGSCQDVTIKDSTITDVSSYGIMSYRSNGTTIQGNTIERAYNEHGIYISDVAAKIVIAKNTIRDTHINGIHINGAVAGAVISGNRLERTGSFPTKEGGAGLTLIGGATAPVVEGNRFSHIYGQGITLDAPGATITGNTFEDCSWSAILGLPHGTNLRMTDNVFKDTGVIPLQFPPGILGSVTASGNRYAANQPVCEVGDGQRKLGLKDWQGMGKDVR